MSKKKIDVEPIEMIWSDRKRHLGMPLSFTKFSLSDDRLFVEQGLLNLQSEEVLLYRVRDIELKMTLWQRIFGVGTVCLSSSDTSAPHVELRNVKSPREVKELIHKKVEKAKKERRVRPMEMVDGATDRDDDPDDGFDDLDN